MHKPSPRYPKINYNRHQLLIEILTKSNMTPKSSPISCQNLPYSADWYEMWSEESQDTRSLEPRS